MPSISSPPLEVPEPTTKALLEFQFSSWYTRFRSITIKSTVIPLDAAFREYMNLDGVFVPEGSEDMLAESTLSDDEDSDSDSDKETRHFAFPELDAKIRASIKKYGAVFPKLNFSSPKDAAWVLAAGSPLKCTTPADVYLILKSSDFVTHDLSEETVFEGCDSADVEAAPPYNLELVLRKWYSVDRSRELRCFVRHERLIGISQRDTNFYDYMNDAGTRAKIVNTVKTFWETKIMGRWPSGDYTFDLLLTRDLTRAHVLDFNPYAPKTDSLLFTYEELLSLLVGSTPSSVPELRVVDSATHPAAISNAPANQHNMIPLEALSLSSGRDIEEFADLWKDEVKRATEDE